LRTRTLKPIETGDRQNGKRIRVFLADDQRLIRRGLAAMLGAQPAMGVVGEALDWWDTVDGARMTSPDVVLVSSRLPGLPALGVTRRLSQGLPGASVVVLAYEREKDLPIRALQAGACVCLLMDSPLSDFVEAVRKAYRDEVFLGTWSPSARVDRRSPASRGGRDENHYGMLSPRERELLPLVAEGRTNGEIAGELGLSPHTVQTHRQRIMKKLDVHSRSDLLKFALRQGIVRLEL
jgi:two-component system response regulator NreC